MKKAFEFFVSTTTDIFSNLEGVLDAIIYAVDPERSLWP